MSRSGERGLAVVAVGGNSLIQDPKHQEVPNQFDAARATCAHVVRLIEAGWRVVLTHGNGPQVGFILRRSELALHELHPVPLDSIDADTQGALGYMLQQSLANEFARRGLAREAVTLVTQVLVDADDPAFANPTKPIGSFLDEATAKKHAATDGWTVREDAGRGWRRVVPSPAPREIVERRAIRRLVEDGFSVIAVGGGGIPVVRDERGDLRGVAAVIDKDDASALLALQLEADLFVISTAVDAVYLDYRQPTQRALRTLTVSEAKRLQADGQFPAGSMGPKIRAAAAFVAGSGREAIITSPEHLVEAVEHGSGTHVVPG